MNEKNLITVLKNFEIPNISENVNFWMIRTKKGYFYEEFIQKEFVALGWNNIDKYTDIGEKNLDTMKDYLKTNYGEKRPQLAINKCHNFMNSIKEGDILLIPNRGTKKITFAIAEEYYEENFSEENEKDIITKIENSEVLINTVECPYNKRRKIKIIKTVQARDINIHLFVALTNYHGLSNLKHYDKQILDCIYSAYAYKDIFSLQVGVNNKNNIDAYSLALLVSGVSGCLKLISDEAIISTTINLNSPGKMSNWFENPNKGEKVFNFIKNSKSKVFLLAVIVVMTGGEVKVGNIEVSLPGAAKVIEDIRSIDLEVEKKEQELEKLQIENFEDTYDVYKKIKDDNINIEEFKEELEKIIKAREVLDLGFDEQK